jgi:GTP-binding protein HflX
VQNVLNQINAGKIPAVTVINKIDKITNQAEKERLKKIYPDSVFVSAVTGLGIDSLLEAIEFRLRDLVKPLNLVIPANRQDIISRIHKIGKIISSQWDHLGRANLVIEIPARFEHEFADFMVLN